MEKVPLGYSDLTSDEGFVVTLFREWREAGPTRAVAEHRIACELQSDTSYAALDPLFRVFEHYYGAAELGACQSDILSEDEEDLLGLLCNVGENGPQQDGSPHERSETKAPCDRRSLAPECRAALVKAAIAIRPCESIHRSGHDRLLSRVAQGYGAVFGNL